MKNLANYHLLLSRRSIRRYIETAVDNLLIEKLIAESNYLEQIDLKIAFDLINFLYTDGSAIEKAVGIFGQIMKPPHLFAPVTYGDNHSLTEAGFRTQQIVQKLWQKGIGSCYIGCAHNAKSVKAILDLPNKANIITFLAYGYPQENQDHRLYQRVSEVFHKTTTRLPIKSLFLEESEVDKIPVGSGFMQILEAGRFSPSATNAQPWRFLIKDNQFCIYAKIKKIPNLYDLNQRYVMHDCGICMANMCMAGEAIGYKIEWHYIDKDDIFSDGDNGEKPLAKFIIREGLL